MWFDIWHYLIKVVLFSKWIMSNCQLSNSVFKSNFLLKTLHKLFICINKSLYKIQFTCIVKQIFSLKSALAFAWWLTQNFSQVISVELAWHSYTKFVFLFVLCLRWLSITPNRHIIWFNEQIRGDMVIAMGEWLSNICNLANCYLLLI